MRLLRPITLMLLLLPGLSAMSQTNLGKDTTAIDFAQPKELEIAGIRVEGIVTLDERSLVARSGLFVGQMINVPGDETSRAIQNLWKLRLFSNIRIEAEKIVGNQVFLVIQLDELPRISKYSPDGLSKAEEDDIVEKIEIVRGTPYTDFVRKDIETKIKDYFADKGFLSTTVEVYAKPDTSQMNWVVMYIDVVKGPKTRISDIVFYGNEEISDRKLRATMKDTRVKTQLRPKYQDPEAPEPNYNPVYILSNLSVNSIRDYVSDRASLRIFNSSRYMPENLSADKKQVIALYNAKGYRDARIVEDTVYYVDDRNLRIDLYVEEGNKYYFRNISWRGNAKYSEGRLDSILGIKPGDIYNQQLLEQKLRYDPVNGDVTSLYMDDGYLFFQLNPVEVAVVGDSIDLEIRIQEGAQATINNIIIKGNTKTKEHVVRRELRTYPGQKFSRSALIRSQSEIARLGYFDPEQIGINPVPNPADGTVDIEYTVVEKPSDQLELSAGYAGGVFGGVVLQAGIVFNNWSMSQVFKKEAWRPVPSGDGQTLSIRVNTNGRRYQSYNFAFVEPWLGGKKPNSLSLSAYRSFFADNDDADFTTLEGSFTTNGASVGYGIRLKFPDDYFNLVSTFSYQLYQLDQYEGFIIENGNSHNISIKETLSRSSVNNPQFPSSGSNITFSVQFTPPYSLLNEKNYDGLENTEKYKFIEYHKWRFTADWYTPVVGKLVFRSAAKFGLMGYYNKDIGISPFERFQLGGDGITNFNFYGTDIIALRGYEIFNVASGFSTARTEPIFTKYTLELRYPISLNPSATISAHAFAEAGNLWSSFNEFNPFDVKRSVGVGLRAWLPMFGLLGLDYGIRFDEKLPGELVPSTGVFNYIVNNGKFTVVLGFEPE
ncbi:MAG: BamA/TamA family outer membrane protein [Chitinophagales bacterium]|nr:BamA/TamA family outer membrane protein [Chitinophagales bacterium]HAE12790.1 outer membrane protein assembly factor BamA [Bacteroidota bacterium]MCB9022141.1 BamA/TamA family outer membrane protein [Chitinophagales bacterium]MCB9031959.1 BamA/TamA family outer membrane protein [Chitinophagales bacterium]HAE34714.1 outer membrane protein assembly factor BamA [Bacteroidota bacterium]